MKKICMCVRMCSVTIEPYRLGDKKYISLWFLDRICYFPPPPQGYQKQLTLKFDFVL